MPAFLPQYSVRVPAFSPQYSGKVLVFTAAFCEDAAFYSNIL
jgi:hypothetical protein